MRAQIYGSLMDGGGVRSGNGRVIGSTSKRRRRLFSAPQLRLPPFVPLSAGMLSLWRTHSCTHDYRRFSSIFNILHGQIEAAVSLRVSHIDTRANIMWPFIFRNIKGDPSKIAFISHLHKLFLQLNTPSFHSIRICVAFARGA